MTPCRHCERSAGIQNAVIANTVKQSSDLLSWIAASATPPRNDGVLWVAVSVSPLPRRATPAAEVLLQ
jgi:hypothetical protein